MKLSVELPDDLSDVIPGGSKNLEAEFRLAASAKWYEAGRLSQERAAVIAGLSRSAFIEGLARLGVPAVQVTPEELRAELGSA